MKTLSWLFGLSLLILAFLLVPTRAMSISNYYKGKTLELIVPFSPGGGTDTAVRFINKHLPKFIPGNPTTIVRNMPGGGGTIGSNYVYSIAKPDGLTMLVTGGSVAIGNLLRTKGAKFDFKNMSPVMVIPSGGIFVTKPHLVKKPEDIVKAKGLIFGGAAIPSSSSIYGLLASKILGYKLDKTIVAYRGGGPAQLAFLSGELNCMDHQSTTYLKKIKPMVEKGEVIPIWQTGLLNEKGEHVREPGVPDIYTVKELYRKIYGSDPSGSVWNAFDMLVGAVGSINFCFLLPPGAEKYATILSDAFEKMVKDPGFQADFNKVFPGMEALVGEKMKKIFNIASQPPIESVNWVRNWLSTDYGLELQP